MKMVKREIKAFWHVIWELSVRDVPEQFYRRTKQKSMKGVGSLLPTLNKTIGNLTIIAVGKSGIFTRGILPNLCRVGQRPSLYRKECNIPSRPEMFFRVSGKRLDNKRESSVGKSRRFYWDRRYFRKGGTPPAAIKMKKVYFKKVSASQAHASRNSSIGRASDL